jgi:glycogen synthase
MRARPAGPAQSSVFHVQDEDEMGALVDQAGQLDPLQCRRSAERFSPDRVAARYEAAYRRALDRAAAV